MRHSGVNRRGETALLAKVLRESLREDGRWGWEGPHRLSPVIYLSAKQQKGLSTEAQGTDLIVPQLASGEAEWCTG